LEGKETLVWPVPKIGHRPPAKFFARVRPTRFFSPLNATKEFWQYLFFFYLTSKVQIIFCTGLAYRVPTLLL
jgi:hypothetical protein